MYKQLQYNIWYDLIFKLLFKFYIYLSKSIFFVFYVLVFYLPLYYLFNIYIYIKIFKTR